MKMEESLTLFRESARHLCVVNCQRQSLKSVFYSNTSQKSKTLFALVSKCLSLHSQIIAGLLKAGVISQESLSSVPHASTLSKPACSTCLLVVATYDLTCGRKPFGCRSAAMRILRENTQVTKAASTLRTVMKGILRDMGSSVPKTLCVPVYARINTLHLSMSEVVEKLRKNSDFHLIEYDREQTSYDEFLEKVKILNYGEFMLDFHFPDLILVLPPGTDLHLNEMYISNELIIQDKASCIPALVLLTYLRLPKTDSVEIIDACASPGNKTTLLISGFCAAQQPGKLIAVDRDEKRFKQLCKNLHQYEGNISLTVNNQFSKTVSASGDCFLDVEARFADFLEMDPHDSNYFNVKAILLDPSCSTSGVHCRRPEFSSEGGTSHERIQRLANLQSKLLRHALSFPSVRLVVYSTCSIYEQENEQVVREQAENFKSSFKLVKIWRRDPPTTSPRTNSLLLFMPASKWESRGTGDEMSRCLRALPERDLTIGFFVACFKRRSKLVDNLKKRKFTV